MCALCLEYILSSRHSKICTFYIKYIVGGVNCGAAGCGGNIIGGSASWGSA